MSDYTPQEVESLHVQAAIYEFGKRIENPRRADYERYASVYGDDVVKLMMAMTEGVVEDSAGVAKSVLNYVFEAGLIRLYARIAGRFAFLSNPALRMNDDAA